MSGKQEEGPEFPTANLASEQPVPQSNWPPLLRAQVRHDDAGNERRYGNTTTLERKRNPSPMQSIPMRSAGVALSTGVFTSAEGRTMARRKSLQKQPPAQKALRSNSEVAPPLSARSKTSEAERSEVSDNASRIAASFLRRFQSQTPSEACTNHQWPWRDGEARLGTATKDRPPQQRARRATSKRSASADGGTERTCVCLGGQNWRLQNPRRRGVPEVWDQSASGAGASRLLAHEGDYAVRRRAPRGGHKLWPPPSCRTPLPQSEQVARTLLRIGVAGGPHRGYLGTWANGWGVGEAQVVNNGRALLMPPEQAVRGGRAGGARALASGHMRVRGRSARAPTSNSDTPPATERARAGSVGAVAMPMKPMWVRARRAILQLRARIWVTCGPIGKARRGGFGCGTPEPSRLPAGIQTYRGQWTNATERRAVKR